MTTPIKNDAKRQACATWMEMRRQLSLNELHQSCFSLTQHAESSSDSIFSTYVIGRPPLLRSICRRPSIHPPIHPIHPTPQAPCICPQRRKFAAPYFLDRPIDAAAVFWPLVVPLRWRRPVPECRFGKWFPLPAESVPECHRCVCSLLIIFLSLMLMQAGPVFVLLGLPVLVPFGLCLRSALGRRLCWWCQASVRQQLGNVSAAGVGVELAKSDLEFKML
jgi:hypothetical protein